MLKNTLPLLFVTIAILLFTGCAERGYTLTSTPSTHTAIAQTTTDLRDKSNKKNIKNNIKKMKEAVKKELKKEKKRDTKKIVKKKLLKKKKPYIQKEKITYDDEALEKKKFEKAVALEMKKAKEEELQKDKKLKDLKQAKIAKALEEKRFEEAKALRAKNKAAEAKALEEQIARDKQLLEEKRLKDLKQAKIAKALEEKRLKEAKALKEKEIKKTNIKRKHKKRKSQTQFTQPLSFKQINKIYHKFGTSEIHGHIIYLDSTGQEVSLRQSKVYLHPISAKLNHWYNNYYLKNKSNNLSHTIVNYLNRTDLNLNKNFQFFGVPEGSYYIIIESLYPSSLKKVYIAKKIKVGKHKKVMAVFSKKL